MKKSRTVLLCCALSLFTLTTQARNTRILLPIQEVLRLSKTKEVIGQDIALYFGDKSPEIAQNPLGEVYGHGKADPYTKTSSGHNRPRDDETTCREAMRTALAELVQQARARGGNALVDISSFYDRTELRSNDVYECHAGMTRAVVELKAKVVRTEPAKQNN